MSVARRRGAAAAAPPAMEVDRRWSTASLLLMIAGLAVYLVWPFALERLGVAPWRYVSSDPPPGAVLAAVPGSVTVRLSDALAPHSTLFVQQGRLTAVDGRPTYVWEDVPVSGAPLDEADPERRTLTTAIRPRGAAPYYRVSWTAAAPNGRNKRYGALYFSVRTPLPAELIAERGAVEDRAVRPRRRGNFRPVAVGALFLLGMVAVRRRTVERHSV